MKTLKAASISEDNYFNNLLGNDVVTIAKDIRDEHNKDAETGDVTTPVDDILDSFEELKTADNATLISANRLKEMDAGRRKNNPKTAQI